MNTAEEEIVSRPPAPRTSPSSEVHYCEHCGAPMIGAPMLKCACCGEVVRLRCFVYSRGRKGYIAECIDLDISAEGETDAEAIAGLQDAMRGYLSVVFEDQDKPDTRGLVMRPAPLSHRLRYHYERLKDKFRALLSKHTRHTAEKFFRLPTPTRCTPR